MSTLPETTKISESQLRWQYLGGKRTFLIVAGCFLVGLLLFRIGFSFWYGARQARQAKVTVAAQVSITPRACISSAISRPGNGATNAPRCGTSWTRSSAASISKELEASAVRVTGHGR